MFGTGHFGLTTSFYCEQSERYFSVKAATSRISNDALKHHVPVPVDSGLAVAGSGGAGAEGFSKSPSELRFSLLLS